jgi:hypothetical protein
MALKEVKAKKSSTGEYRRGGVGPVDQAVDQSVVEGAPTEELRPDRREQREESTTRPRGQLVCLVLLPVC